eukprot:tig00001250_g7797.t1
MLSESEIASFLLPEPSSSVVGASRGQRRRHILLTLTQAVQVHDAESRQIIKSWTTKPSAQFSLAAVWRDGRIYAVQKRNTLICWSEVDEALDRAKTRTFDGEISYVRALERGPVLVVTASGTVSACDPATLAVRWTESLLDGEASSHGAVAEHVFAHSSGAGDGVYAVLRRGHEYTLAVHLVVHEEKGARRLLPQGSYPLPGPATASKKQHARLVACDVLPSAAGALALLWSDGSWEVHAFAANPLAQTGAALPPPPPRPGQGQGREAGAGAPRGLLLAAVSDTHVAIAGTRAGSSSGEKLLTVWDAVYGSAHAVHALAEADEGPAPPPRPAPPLGPRRPGELRQGRAGGGGGAGAVGYLAVCGARSLRACSLALRPATLAAALAGHERTRALAPQEPLAAAGAPLQAAPLDLRGLAGEADLAALARGAREEQEREAAAVRALLEASFPNEAAFLAAFRPWAAARLGPAPSPAPEAPAEADANKADTGAKKGKKKAEAKAEAEAPAAAAAAASPSKAAKAKGKPAASEGRGVNGPYVAALAEKCAGAGYWTALGELLGTGRVQASEGLLKAVLESGRGEALERYLLQAAGVPEWEAIRALRHLLALDPSSPGLAPLARSRARLATAPAPAPLLARDTPIEHLLRALVCLPRSDLFMVQCLRALSARETAVLLRFLRKWLRRYVRHREGEWRAAGAATGERIPSLGQLLDWAGMLLDAQFAALALRPELRPLVTDTAALCRALTLSCARLAPIKDYINFIVAEKGPLPSRPIGAYTVELVEL